MAAGDSQGDSYPQRQRTSILQAKHRIQNLLSQGVTSRDLPPHRVKSCSTGREAYPHTWSATAHHLPAGPFPSEQGLFQLGLDIP